MANHPQQLEELRGVMIGAGSISRHHVEAWRQLAGVRIAAVADSQRERALQVAELLRISDQGVFQDAEEMLDTIRPDFADIASPLHCHADQVRMCADRGVHVLCQKPFASTLEEAQELVDHCRSAQTRCIVNENWRWRTWYRDVNQLIRQGTIGTPHIAAIRYHGDDVLPDASGAMPALLVRQPFLAQMPRMLVLEWGIHLVDVMRFLLGGIEQVCAAVERISPLIVGEDRAQIEMIHETGARSQLDLSWSSYCAPGSRLERGSVEPFRIEGSLGMIELDPTRQDLCTISNSEGRRQFPVRGIMSRAASYQSSFNSVHQHFIDCLWTGRPAENEAEDNLETLAATLAIYESSQTGTPVPVKFFVSPMRKS